MTILASPLITVVIPTYNHAHYLGRALQSVLNQTYKNWEAIVIDNHSTDNTDGVMKALSDRRISYLKIHNDGVIAVSRNAGIKAAKGEWIAFLDSDDWWAEDKLQVIFDHISKKVDLIYHDLEIISDQPRRFGRKLIHSWQVKPPIAIDLMIRGNAIATSSVVVRSELLKQLNGMSESPDMVGAEDCNTWMRIAQLTNGFRYVPKRLGFYQVHPQGVSSRKEMSTPTRCAFSEYVNLLSPRQLNKFEANLRYTKGRFEYLLGNKASAKENLRFSFKYGKAAIKLKSALMLIIGTILR